MCDLKNKILDILVAELAHTSSEILAVSILDEPIKQIINLTANKWISMDDELPAVGEEVIVIATSDEFSITRIAVFKDRYNFVKDGVSLPSSHCPILWAHMPTFIEE